MQESRNFVILKTKQSLAQNFNQSVTRKLRLDKPLQIMGKTAAHPVILLRNDSLEQIEFKFPGLVTQKVLFTFTSKFY